MTMEIIQRIELGSSQSTIEFTSIPQTFTDLLLVTSLRSDRGAGAVVEVTKLEFNGSTSGYSYRELVGDGSGVQSSSGSITRHGLIPAASATSNTFSNDQSYIPNYTGSTQKSFSSETVMENNATTSYQDIVANLWTGTSAITSIRLSNVFSSNFVAGSSATLYGIKKFTGDSTPKAIGGSVTQAGGYWIHTFNSSGTFRPLENLTNVEYLVIAGGGGAGSSGGGGAGGYRSSVVGESSGGGASAEARLSLTANTDYSVLVGAGGTNTANGSNSAFHTITSIGGGSADNNLSRSGGSGSGFGGGSSGSGGAGTANQGYAGGNGGQPFPNDNGGGGGGAAQAGSAGANGNGGAGGNGVSSSITGTAVTRAGGGGGQSRNLYYAPAGLGGGGIGGSAAGVISGGNGVANTGGGGGGGYAVVNGGSGVVIVRYSA